MKKPITLITKKRKHLEQMMSNGLANDFDVVEDITRFWSWSSFCYKHRIVIKGKAL